MGGLLLAPAIPCRHLVSGNLSSPGTCYHTSYMSHEVSPIFLIGEWRSRGLIKIHNGAFGGYKNRRSLQLSFLNLDMEEGR